MKRFVPTAALVVIISGMCMSVFGSEERQEVDTWNGFQFTFKGFNDLGRANKLEVKELSTARTVFRLESPDLLAGHYHCCEYADGNLYVIKRTGDDSTIGSTDDGSPLRGRWTDELWRFQPAGEARKLYESQGLDFRASPKGDVIAVILEHRIAFLDPLGKLVHETVFPPAITDLECERFEAGSSVFVGLGGNSKWTKDGSEFWGAIGCLYVTPLFYKIAVPTWEVITYRRSTSPKEAAEGWPDAELVLDPDSAKIAFSDYPHVFDADTHEEIRKSRKKFHLWLQDLNTGLVQRVATAAGKGFKPEWVGADVLEYDDPFGDKRVRLDIDPGHFAGIDCDKDNSHVGRLICADATLLQHDYEISYLYQVLVSVTPDIQRAERERLEWVGKRDKCRDGRCLDKVYQERIEGLERQLTKLRVAQKEPAVTEEYSVEAAVSSGSTDGSKEPLGELRCCLRIRSFSAVSFIDFTIEFPDSAQILEVRVPAVRDKTGALNFRFVDGWGNWGKGSFRREGQEGVLMIEEIRPTDDPWGRNVLRQYGEYSLTKSRPGTCRDQRQ
ncbi:MAG: hypothetical protein V1792_07450 [Pseudomonadota bacterium]